ncbi:MAG: hypothetical protein AVDCRST_MAG87-3551 [uncultured Thermomicrobiales bacterium]|uniref:Uncharacterized protein n=1 Tax=uncultured Thermomicrobiales bacterium TaxID=1645740 RepID=A0A6J4VLW9_9BACT|nr:MAG: hypothetical protein AVDCRST_MAG87-3551 [uncultured Thermomicrobiales bacterium]
MEVRREIRSTGIMREPGSGHGFGQESRLATALARVNARLDDLSRPSW